MIDESRKRLTRYLGECWHHITVNDDGYSMCECDELPCVIEKDHQNRTFTTWPDLGALKERIEVNEEWDDFLQSAKGEFEIGTRLKRDNIKIYYSRFTQHLLNPTRFCELVDKWRKGKEK